MNPWGVLFIILGILLIVIGIRGTQGNVKKAFVGVKQGQTTKYSPFPPSILKGILGGVG